MWNATDSRSGVPTLTDARDCDVTLLLKPQRAAWYLASGQDWQLKLEPAV